MAAEPIILHPSQLAFHRSEALIRGFVGGRGAGKSWIGSYDLCQRAQAGRLYMLVSDTYRQLRDSTLRVLIKVARRLGCYRDLNKSEMVMTIAAGDGEAEILLRSADEPDGLRGPSLSGVFLDEASLMTAETFDIVIACLREEEEMGWITLCFTPKGPTHWSAETFFVEPPPPDWPETPAEMHDDAELFHATSKDNPFLPEQFYSTIARRYTGTFRRQELEGRFLVASGLIFSGDWFQVVEPWEIPINARRARYWDKAGTPGGGSYSAGVLVAATDDQVFIEDVVRGQWTYAVRDSIMLQTATADAARYGNVVMQVVEQEGGSGGLESAQRSVRMLRMFPTFIDKVGGNQRRYDERKAREPGYALPAKVLRSQPFAAQAEAGNVFLVRGKWNDSFTTEAISFPSGSTDQIDAAAGAYNKLAARGPVDGDPPSTMRREVRPRESMRFKPGNSGNPRWRHRPDPERAGWMRMY